jgi:hypothetical protein
MVSRSQEQSVVSDLLMTIDCSTPLELQSLVDDVEVRIPIIHV